MQKRKLVHQNHNGLFDNDDDDEVRYDEIAPQSTVRIADRDLEHQAFKIPNQRQSDFSEKIITRALLESRRNRQPNQPDKESRPTRSSGPLFSLLESEIVKSNASIDSSAIFNLDSYAQQEPASTLSMIRGSSSPVNLESLILRRQQEDNLVQQQQAQQQIQEQLQEEVNRQQQQHQHQHSFFSSAASQDSVQLGANTLLFMANNSNAQPHAPSSSQSAFPAMSQSSHITSSQIPPRHDTNSGFNSNRQQCGTQQSQSQYEIQRDLMSFHGVNRFDRNQGSGRSRDIWLPNGTKAINEYSLEQSDINIKNSTTPHSNICSMDRPSHWGSKPKCTRKPERRTRMKANDKNPKSSRESFGFGERSLVSTAKPKLVMAGMIAQFPPSKISTEAGKLDSMSFKPLWLQSVTPNVDFDMHRTNLRDFNVDEIQEVRGEAMVKNVSMVTSAAEDPKENRAIVTNTSPQASRQLSLSSGGHKDRKIDKVMDKDIDSFNEGHSVRQIDWRSPSTKVLKGGKKVRSKAGSLKAIYQKLTRNIEEKECRMLNITSLDDPQHPRNRALFYLDITVVEEKEIWPFRILSAYISKIERKQSRPPRKSGADVLLFYPSLSGDGDGTLNLHNNEEPDTVGDEYRHQEYLQPINVANKNDYDRSKNLDEADTRTSLTAAADSNERNERVEAYEMVECRLSPSNYQNALPHSDVLVAEGSIDRTSLLATSEQDVQNGTISHLLSEKNDEIPPNMTRQLTRHGNQEQEKILAGATEQPLAEPMSPFHVGMHVCAYFKADGFQKGKNRNVRSGTVVRVYDPEVFHGTTGDLHSAADATANRTVDCSVPNDGFQMGENNHASSSSSRNKGGENVSDIPPESSIPFCQTSGSSDKQPIEGTFSCTDTEVNEQLEVREGGQNCIPNPLSDIRRLSHELILKIICTQIYEILKS